MSGGSIEGPVRVDEAAYTRRAEIAAKRVAALEKARAVRMAKRAAVLQSQALGLNREESVLASIRAGAAAAAAGSGGAALGQGQGQGQPEQAADASQVEPEAMDYSAAPEQDWRGDKTPAFVEWLWENYPGAARVRYAGRWTHLQARESD